jgi:F-type H+-transporting ATPase subunit b
MSACFGAVLMAAEEHGSGGGHGTLDFWKWINFALLVGIFAYFLYKKAGGFFRTRTGEIVRDLKEAARQKTEAEARYAEIDRRLASLGAEIEALRGKAREESAAEHERLRRDTERDLAKIQAQAEQEIAAASKAARQALRAYSAELAVELAQEKLQARITPESDDALVRSMLAQIGRGRPERAM